jgi:hypothetical protein
MLRCEVRDCISSPSIFSRNSPSLGLVIIAITITDPAFYKLVADGTYVFVNLDANRLEVGGKPFEFELMEANGTT